MHITISVYNGSPLRESWEEYADNAKIAEIRACSVKSSGKAENV